jgi:predicted DNA-binding transcriptional regulator YafY
MRHEKAGGLLQLARALAATAEGLTLEEMAAEAGVGRRTAERMRDALWTLFPQMEEVADPPTKRFRIPHGLDGLFQSPNAEELVELSKAADQLAASGAPARAEALRALEKKVRSAMRSGALRRLGPDVEALARAETIAVQAGPRPAEDPQIIGAIRQAVMAMRAIRFRYSGGSRQGVTRDVAPYGIMFGRANYLVGAELGSKEPGEPRNYRLDRIEDLEVLDRTAAAPEAFNLQDYASRSFGIYQGEVQEIVLSMAPEAAADALGWRFHPSQIVEPQADGSVVVRFWATGLLELAWHLFTWGDRVRVVRPEALRLILVEELERALAGHTARRSPRTGAVQG